MNLMTIDLNDENLLNATQKQWILGLVRCRLVTWNEPERDQYLRTVNVITDFGGRTRWYSECRAFQVMEEARRERRRAPHLTAISGGAIPGVPAPEPLVMRPLAC
jgi:hypothetical protein